MEVAAQHYAALVIRTKSQMGEEKALATPDYHNVDINSLDLLRPRSVGAEHVAVETLRQLELDRKLTSLGFTKSQMAAAIALVTGRMVAPGSELYTYGWLQEQTGLGELIEHDFSKMSLMQLYRVSDLLFEHKETLEHFLYQQEQSLFEFEEVITLYDLTNTYFEGEGKGNSNAELGHSKEKRSDCPLVTLALVLDGSGFPKRSEIFAGNVSEPVTLPEMVDKLASDTKASAPTVVLDAGIATEDNIGWLADNHYRYIVVSRKRHRQFCEKDAVLIKEDGNLRIQIQRIVNSETKEVELYCHSSQREKKDRGIKELFYKRFEDALKKLAEGLHKKGYVKKYDKVLERIGRLKEKYSRAAQHFEITVECDKNTGNANAINWKRKTTVDDTLPGVYCLRSATRRPRAEKHGNHTRKLVANVATEIKR